MKTCPRCEQRREPQEFYTGRNVCRECHKAAMRAARAAQHPYQRPRRVRTEADRQRDRAWEQANRERRREYQRQWRQANREAVAAYNRAYHQRRKKKEQA